MAGVNGAIRTRYKGILFRSKLEADWAISLDGLEIEWQYEPEGRYWGDVYYAPDFWLPRTQQWFEVKGVPADQDLVKWAALEKHWQRAPTPECHRFLADNLGPELYVNVLGGTLGIDIPPLVIGLPHGMLQPPSLIADLAALPPYDDEGMPAWPEHWREIVLLTGVGFFGWSYDDEPCKAFHDRDGLWGALNGFPYRDGVRKFSIA